jgi:hypothetical protein
MNSTEKSPVERDRQIKEFFEEKIVPLAQKLRDRGVAFFAPQPDSSSRSYFAPYSSDRPVFEIETSAIPTMLKDHWGNDQLAELIDLVDPLLELASAVADESPPEDVSPFIYVMF